MKAKKIKSITIIGKRWFDKVYGMSESIWQYCKRNDIVYSCYVSDVSRKKDLRW